MSYQVLARKWRPRRFAELVGQEHVVRALSHALDAGRIHHAFLFTGTRGVGKTTIARIFAKSLNCERGIGSNPCGECGSCRDIDAGRFLDLLEIDAASNTGVDDVREVIENAQYAPARGAYKVYLIDEVHMLSKSAFNALLKTLEEPPPHVKFLLATTDPQKLPVTVLSRCLQFHLKRLADEQIEGQLRRILEAEGVGHDADSVCELARGGNGSMRDALSLLDQAIAYGGGELRADEVRTMLGTIDRARVRELLATLARGDAAGLWTEVETIAEFAPDFGAVLDELATLLHRVQLAQLVPSVEDQDPEFVRELAAALHPEDVQLMYQLALSGRHDLALAPGPRIGFEMALLRMLAFRPQAAAAPSAPDAAVRGGARTAAAAASRSAAASAAPAAVAEPPRPAPRAPPTPAPVAATAAAGSASLDLARWQELLAPLSLRGPLRELAHNAVPLALDAGRLRLGLRPVHEHLRSDALVRQLTELLAPALGAGLRLQFEAIDGSADSVADKQRRDDAARQIQAEAAIAADPVVRGLMAQFDAKVVPNSARPKTRE